ncbi:MAG: hypothetical protein Q9225_001885 [Loekoesia sp. 1 TL-2023]
MEAVGLVASISQLIDITAKTIKYLNSVKDASGERSRLFLEASSLLPLLATLQDQVGRVDKEEARFDSVRSLAAEHGPLDQLRKALEQLGEKLKPKKGVKNATRAFIWTLDKAYCENLLATIERAKSSIGLALQGDTFTLARAIKADTAGIALIDKRTSTIAGGIDTLQAQGDSLQQQKILEWLSPLNFLKTQQDIFARREEGTDRKLCCPGIPGAGKSILASVVVDSLRTFHLKHDSVGVAAIYCNFKHSSLQTPENLLAGLCAQLIQQSLKPISNILDNLYNIHSRSMTRPKWKDIVQIFEDHVTNLDTVYLVIDALDECSEDVRKVLLRYFEILPSNIRLLLTTRHIDEITREFRDDPMVEIRASPSDLKRFVTSSIASNRRLADHVRNQASLEQEICERVITKADGMFLAAKLNIDSLSTKSSIKLLKRALENLSGDLTVLYDDAFLRIQSQSQDDRELAEKALCWVAYTYGPLSVDALREAMAIQPGQTDFDYEALPPIGWILDVCAGLLIHDAENQIIRLVHETAQEYLVAIQDSKFPKVHATIASHCITYLSYECFQHAQGLSDMSDDKTESNPEKPGDNIWFYFLTYASHFWAQHVKASRDPELSIQVHQFLTRDPHILMDGYQIPYSTKNPTSTRDFETHHGVNVAAFFGLCDELKVLINDADDSTALIRKLNTLRYAAHGNQDTAVNVLLDHGADIERRDRDGLTPLLLAIESESLKATTALVDREADVMVVSTGYFQNRTPIASIRKIPPTPYLELLLKAGATVRTEDIFDATKLMTGLIRSNDVNTARMLFGKYTTCEPKKINIPSSALRYASQCGSMEIVEMLLDQGADINSRADYSNKTALHKASEHGELAALEFLLGHGADIDAQSSEGVTPLSIAASRGHDACVLALLRRNANVNMQDEYGITPLHGASASCSLTTTEELV